jgi:uncharacterized protein
LPKREEGMKFWIDMDNAPHVLVLRPIIAELERRGHSVEITARDYGQTLPLLRLYGLKALCVGRHAGKSKVRKYLAFLTRSLRLLAFAAGKGFDAAFSHGSRSLVPVARLLGLPLISMQDYEYTSFPRFIRRWTNTLLVPEVVAVKLAAAEGMPRTYGYPGLKEDLYIRDFEPDPSFLCELKIDPNRILVLMRPPATMAHYAVRQSETIFYEALEYLGSLNNVQVLLLPRTIDQGKELEAIRRKHGYPNLVIPEVVYHGPNLIWHSDLVISGGGTMNREAASLNVPVYSIYQGPIGAVDKYLIESGRLCHIKSIVDLKNIPLIKSARRTGAQTDERRLKVRDFIVARILETAQQRKGREK